MRVQEIKFLSQSKAMSFETAPDGLPEKQNSCRVQKISKKSRRPIFFRTSEKPLVNFAVTTYSTQIKNPVPMPLQNELQRLHHLDALAGQRLRSG